VQGVPQAIVHIGPHKTSSSHIQSSLFGISQELDNANFFWPTRPDGKRIEPKGVANFAYALKGMGSHVQADLDIMDQFLEQSLQNNRSIILSSEEFDDMSPQHIASLKKHLAGFDVTIVFVYRELLSQLISLHFELNRFEHDHTVHFSTSLASYLFAVLDNLPLILRPTEILGRYSAVFGQEHIRILDLVGTSAAGKDIAHVLVCQIAGVLCGRADLFRPSNANPSYSLIPAQVFSFYKTYIEQHQCSFCGTVRSEYNQFVARYNNHTTFHAPPRIAESKLSMLRPYAQQTDVNLRSKYGPVILQANQKANFQDMWKVHVRELDVERFVADAPWNNWIHEEYKLARAEGRLCHCLT